MSLLKISTNTIAHQFLLLIELIERQKEEKRVRTGNNSKAHANGFKPKIMLKINKTWGLGKEVLAEESSLLSSYRPVRSLIKISNAKLNI